MCKRCIALLLALVLLLGMLAITPVTMEAKASETVTDFQVGFARVDINPYVVDGDINSGIMALPLYGSGDVWNRLSTAGLVDDNGDGKVNTEDGLKATCIAVTDYKDNTVLLITVDMIGALQVTRVLNAVLERVNAAVASGEVKNVVMDISRIYYTGTHTHNAPQADAYSANGMTGFNNAGVDLSVVNQNLGIWIQRTVEDIADAAILALKDRAAAKISKDAISASSCTNAAVTGKVMNSVRHYNNATDGCVAGDNFNDRGSNPKQVTQVNDTLYLLKFDFSDHNKETGESKLPIILANWRGHPSLNNTNSYKKSSTNCISSDYVGAFRNFLETRSTINADGTYKIYTNKQNRVAFFQAAGGNVNPRGYEKTNGTAAYSWIDTTASSRNDSRGNIYGRILAAMAKDGLTSSSNRESVEAGEIRTLRYYKNGMYNATGVSALAYEAARDYQTKERSGTYAYTSPYTGEIYVIGSKFHASSLISRWNVGMQTPVSSNVTLEINTIMIGGDLAFVTGSGELFDYYKEKGVYTKENNVWNDLNNASTYGTPFVLELCNAMSGYVPNSYAYDYNLGSLKWARGSYEAQTTPYAQGTGEEMIQTMQRMLDTLAESADGSREAVCQHCGIHAVWVPYDGKTEMVSGGHYYLPEDNFTAQIQVKNGKTVCFDLNGHTISGDTRVFYTASDGNATVNLMDSSPNQTGVARGAATAPGAAVGFGGGALMVDKGNTFNFYGGTLECYNKGINTICYGGTAYVVGTMNMYGGTIRGSYADSFDGEYISSGTVKSATRTGSGAAVYVSGTFNVYGGVVESGKLRQVTGTVGKDVLGNTIYMQSITDREGNGACVYSAKGKVTMAGDAWIDDVYFTNDPSSCFAVNTENKPFTGRVNISYLAELSSGRVGKCTEGTQLPEGAITYTFGDVETVVDGEHMTIVAGAVTKGLEKGVYYYTTLTEALKDFKDSADSYIRLLSNVAEDLTVDRDTNLDLYGYTVDGDVYVADGATLYCMDYYTDDYNVEDNHYGRLTGVLTGNIEGVAPMTVSPVKSGYRAGYLRVNGCDGVSFHRVELQINSMSLRPNCAGVYYQSPFKADQVVAERIKSFGICLSVESVDAAQTMIPGTYTAYQNFASGSNGNQKASTLVADIMSTKNSDAQNLANGQMMIYACAYLHTEDGFAFGIPVARSFWQQVKDIDDIWDDLTDTQKASVNKLYDSYEGVMDQWGLSCIGAQEEISE